MILITLLLLSELLDSVGNANGFCEIAKKFEAGESKQNPGILSLNHDKSHILSLDHEASTRWDDRQDVVLGWDASDRLSDSDVGMTEYAKRKRSGTGGTIKTTWSDFRVQEIRKRDGNVVALTHQGLPGKQSLGQPYIRFVMAKAGYDTISAVGRLAAFANLDRNLFSFAGIKDKSAVTCQEVTLRIDSAARSDGLCARLCAVSSRFPRIIVGNLEYCHEPLLPGAHGGNLFTILLRRLPSAAAIFGDEQESSAKAARMIARSVERVRRRGFVNYYGHQRFGLGMRSGMPTIPLGKALLQVLTASPGVRWLAARARFARAQGAISDHQRRFRTIVFLRLFACHDPFHPSAPYIATPLRALPSRQPGSYPGRGVRGQNRWDEAVGLAMSAGSAADAAEADTKRRFSAGWAAVRNMTAGRAAGLRALAGEALQTLPSHCFGTRTHAHAGAESAERRFDAAESLLRYAHTHTPVQRVR
jgi:hypothetical protein